MRYSARRAATAVEYGLIAGAILLAIIGSVRLAGSSLANVFSSTSDVVGKNSHYFPGNPIPGVTGVGPTPQWVTTACQVPSVAQMAQLVAAGSVPADGPALGCIPAGSKITLAYDGPSANWNNGYGVYVQNPGSNQKYLYAVDLYSSTYSYTGFSTWANGAPNPGACASGYVIPMGYENYQIPVNYPPGTYNSTTYVCSDSGLSGSQPASSFIQFVDWVNAYSTLGVSYAFVSTP